MAAFTLLSLVVFAEMALVFVAWRPKRLKSNQLACAMAKKSVKTVNSRNCRRESISMVLMKSKKGNVLFSYLNDQVRWIRQL